MRITFLIFCWSLLIYSCTEVTYQEPQPVGVASLKEIPPTLQGMYQPYKKSTGETGDTLIIEEKGYRFKDKDEKDWLGRGMMSDSLVVKFYKNYYFVNFKYQDQWILRLVKEKSPGVLEFLSIDLDDEKTQKEIIKKLSSKFSVKQTKIGEDVFYKINPTSSQIMKLIQEGYFTGVELRKMK
jgi:hypothetical protein